MENLLNSDGTPSFTNISSLRENFEVSFAKKHLGAAMKDIVVKAMNKIENSNAEDVLSDDKVRKIIGNSVSEISDKCYTNDELNGSSYIGGLKAVVKEYASMESQYREDLANAILSTERDKAKAGGKIMELFSTENLDFSSKELKEEFWSRLNVSFSMEAEDIVTAVGKEVGSAIAEAEEKNVIINETSKVIQDKQDEIREELSVDDEDDEEEDESSNDDEYDDSEDTGEEPDQQNEEESDDATGEEGYEYGIERLIGLSSDEREEALKFFESQKPKMIKGFKDFYAKLSKAYVDLKNKEGEKYHFKPYFNSEKEFADQIEERIEKVHNGLKNKKGLFGNSRNKFSIKLCTVRGMKTSKYILAYLLSCIPYVGAIGAYAIILSDEDGKKADKVIKETQNAASTVMESKIYLKESWNDGEYLSYDLYMKVRFNLKKFWQAGGLEDYDSEVIDIEDRLDEALVNDIENGKVTIGSADISLDSEVVNVSEHTEDGETGENEKLEPEQIPEVTESDPSETAPLVSTDTELAVSTEDYRRLKYSNEYLGRVIVPLSPTRLDSIEIPSAKALGSIYAKGSESLNSLKTVITGRLNLLGDIVEREQDEELTKKYNDYKARALEAFDDALDIQGTFASIGITPYGIEDVNDPLNVNIGAKAYKYLSGDLDLKNKTPKVTYKGLEDAIDAAFDIAIMKDAARRAKTNDDLIAINKDRMSREDLFWNNITQIEADDSSIDQVKNILQFGDLDIDKKALVDTSYLTSINVALDTIGVKKPGKTESEIHEEIFNRSKERIESFLGKDLTYQQLEIIEAMIENRDTSDYAPTPFEKFVIKLGTDKVLEKNGGKDFEVGQESANEIKNKAIVFCTLNSLVDKLNPMNLMYRIL